MSDLRLHHIGEPLVARMLTELEARGKLSRLVCPMKKISVEDDIAKHGLSRPLRFLPEQARLKVVGPKDTYFCDGAQKADVLCVSSDARALALELKLGEERLGANEFKKRFITDCVPSHEDTRLKGPIISVLARRFSRFQESQVIAMVKEEEEEADAREFKVLKPWWLVLRTSIWNRWSGQVSPELGEVRILLLEDMIRELGGGREFNRLVRELVTSEDYFSDWGLHRSQPEVNPAPEQAQLEAQEVDDSEEEAYWNYRVMVKEGEYAIHEVYYEGERVSNYTAEPVSPSGESIEELTNDVRSYLSALEKPVLEWDD